MKPLILAVLLLSLASPAFARGRGMRHTGNGELIFYLLLAGAAAVLRGGSMARGRGRANGPRAGAAGPVFTMTDTKGTDALVLSVSASDPDMAPERLRSTVSAVFLKLQQCRAAGDYAPMGPLLTPHLYAARQKKLAEMRARGEVNRMDAVQVLGITFAHLNYTQNPEERSFTALVRASARDYFVDENGSFLRGDASPQVFSEFWTFRLQNGAWLLDEIEQPGASGAPGRENFCWTRAGGPRTTFSEPDPVATAAILGTASLLPSGAASLAPFTPAADLALSAPIAPLAPIAPIPPLTMEDLPSGGLYAPAPPPPPPGRELTPRAPAAGNWSRTGTELAAAMAFLNVYAAWEKGALTPDAEAELLPAMRGEFTAMLAACRAQGLAFRFEGLSVARAEVALVNSSPPAPEEEFVARITARAVKTLSRNGRTMHRDAAPAPFTEYWVFAKSAGRWKLKELLPRANGKIVLKQDDQETDSNPAQMEWYYKNGAAA